ncbi:unnamed protein product [Rotaria magnacalcarata]
MSSSVYYNTIQSSKPPQPTAYNYHHQHRQHHHHSSHHSSPVSHIPNVSSFTNHHFLMNNNNHSIQSQRTLLSTPTLLPNQSSAYFLDRIDLENYSTSILKQTVENIVSTTQSKGLKVKLLLPDDGLIINNITDPNQSWILKKSELLYFWRDSNHLNIIVVVTKNRSRHHSERPYSASIFRLRGTDSTQLFLQQAQIFFANLSISATTSNTSKSSRNKSVEQPILKENRTSDQKSLSSLKTKTKPHSNAIEKPTSTKKTVTNRDPSPKTTAKTNIRRVTRAEFDTGKVTINPARKKSNNRTYSETASSIDSQTTSSTREVFASAEKSDDNDDDKMTTTNNNLSTEQVAELMRELKQLRNEIASLKLEKRILTSTRSMSTSPLTVHLKPLQQRTDSSTTTSPTYTDVTSQSEVDAQTQTDFSLLQIRRRQLSKKNKKTMIGSSSIAPAVKKKLGQSETRNSRTLSSSSTTTGSDQEGTSVESSSQVDTSSNDTSLSLTQETYQPPAVTLAPPRPVLVRNQNGFVPLNNNSSTSHTILNGNHAVSNFHSTEEGPLLPAVSVIMEKEMPTFPSINISSSNQEIMRPSLSGILTGTASNLPLPSENSKVPAEHIYENIPIMMQPNSNPDSYHNIPIINVDEQQQQHQEQKQEPSNEHVYSTIPNNQESEMQQQYPISGQTIANFHPTVDNDSSENQPPITTVPQQKPQIISAGRHRNQPIYFANHLTNPIFNIDKQLLINTVANQFGVDLNSPQLQQLVTNQHLFAARKRTFANMVWQLTPDEETALCSPHAAIQIDLTETEALDSDYASNRSILKANNGLQSTSKRRNITWDSTLD